MTAIDSAKSAYIEEAAHIAETHGHSLKWTHSQLFLKSQMLRQHRSVNSWNAFVRVKHMEANEGHKKGTSSFTEHSRLMLAEKRALNAKVVEARQQKSHAARANSKATRHDMNATFTSMDREWMALCARTGAEGFYVAVRSSIEDLSEPKIFFMQKAENFVQDVLKVEPRHLGLKLKSFINQHMITTRLHPLNKLVSDCRTLIQEELKAIALEHNIKGKVNMNYTNYERNIVDHYGLALVNWPLSGHVRNPSKVGGRAQVQSLLDALKSRSCEWVRLMDEEHVTHMKDNQERHARGELVYVARKARKIAAASQHKSNETVDSSSEDDTSSDSE
ncbi:hypothetical protein EV702DRAFT_1197119 [Suillus placidus]|uniref:Uncharacterized protein n=1 Tax=Suillus placidus TaxID=48579 RepID=A0A9P7D393_9AGAM|nr:hypothetical protein EV702DRAFT_1197119 [Suillus placidus]